MNEKTGARRQTVMTIAGVLVALVTVGCGDSDGPVAPTPQIPQVSGVYSGQMLMEVGRNVWAGTARISVGQAGRQVTVGGSVDFAGHTVPINAMTGTIDAAGTFSGTAGQGLGAGLVDLLVLDAHSQVREQAAAALLGGDADYTCGAKGLASASLVFSGQTVQFSETWTTTQCGLVEVSGTLTA